MTAYHCAPGSVRWGLLVLGCLALLATDACRADEWFLKIDGVPGVVTEGQFAGWTPVHSAGALVCLPAAAASPLVTNDDTAGRPSFSCEIRKGFDPVSPSLLQHCGDGVSYRKVTLACRVTQPRPALHRITLENVLVSSLIQTGGTSAAGPEKVRLNFEKMEFACLEVDPNGGLTGGLTARFDRVLDRGDLRARLPFRMTTTRQNGHPGVWVTWPAERGHHYEVHTGTANGGVWKTSDGGTAASDGMLSLFLPTDAPNLLMRVQEVD